MSKKTGRMLSLLLALAMVLSIIPAGLTTSATGTPGTLTNLVTKYSNATTALATGAANSGLFAVQGSTAAPVTKYDSTTGYSTTQARAAATVADTNPLWTTDQTKRAYGDRYPRPTTENNGSTKDVPIRASTEFVINDTTSPTLLGENVTKVLALNTEKDFTLAIPDLYSFNISQPATIYVASGGTYDANYVDTYGWTKETSVVVNRASIATVQNVYNATTNPLGDNLWYAIPNGSTTMGTVYSLHSDSGTVNIPSRGVSSTSGLAIFVVWDSCNSLVTVKNLTVGGSAVSNFSQNNRSYNISLPAGTTVGSPEATITASAHASCSVAITQATSLPGPAKVVVTSGDGSSSITYNLYLTVLSPTAVVNTPALPQADAAARANGATQSNGGGTANNINYILNDPAQSGSATKWAYMRFDLTPYTTPIVSAKLTYTGKMSYQTATTPIVLPTADMPARVPYGIVEIYPVNETVTYNSASVPWLEGTGVFYGTQPSDAATKPYLCWNVKPAISSGMGRIASVSRYAFGVSTANTIDLTSYLRARKAAGATTATILIREPQYIFSSQKDLNTVQMDIISKESSNIANRPSLVVTTDTAETVMKNMDDKVAYLTTGTVKTTSELNLKFNQFDPYSTEVQTFDVAPTDLPLKINAYMADANAKIVLNDGTQATGIATTTVNASDFTIVGTQKEKTFTMVTTAEDGITSKTYLIKLTLPYVVGTDSTLNELSYTHTELGKNVIPLSSGSTSYDVVLPYGLSSEIPQVGGVPTSIFATIKSITQATSIPGSATIVVAAEDLSETSYTINFTKSSTPPAAGVGTVTNITYRGVLSKGTGTDPVAVNGLKATSPLNILADNVNYPTTADKIAAALDPAVNLYKNNDFRVYSDRDPVAGGGNGSDSSSMIGSQAEFAYIATGDYATSPEFISQNVTRILTRNDEKNNADSIPDAYTFSIDKPGTVYIFTNSKTNTNIINNGWMLDTKGLQLSRSGIADLVGTDGKHYAIPNGGSRAYDGVYTKHYAAGANVAIPSAGASGNGLIVLVYWDNMQPQTISSLTLNTPANLIQAFNKLTAVAFHADTAPAADIDRSTITWYVNDVLQTGTGSKFSYTPTAVGTYVITAKVSNNPDAVLTSKTITVNVNGDINGDEVIDISDVIMTAEISVGYGGYTPEQIVRANVSDKNDPTVDISDVVMIAERAVGSTTPFPIDQ